MGLREEKELGEMWEKEMHDRIQVVQRRGKKHKVHFQRLPSFNITDEIGCVQGGMAIDRFQYYILNV